MSRTNFNLVEGSLSYEAPSVKTLDIVVEGVLCASSGTTQKYTLPDATEDNWGTL
ncbi:MAG: hypothetical protein IJZ70_04935 [Bacteroidales bacterium]|nr:hypothetical protein [Bacteroidales bacterium]